MIFLLCFLTIYIFLKNFNFKIKFIIFNHKKHPIKIDFRPTSGVHIIISELFLIYLRLMVFSCLCLINK